MLDQRTAPATMRVKGNRLVKAGYSSGDLTDSGQLIGDYEYDGKNRRLQRIVANRGSLTLSCAGLPVPH